ncbi:MAG: Lrp/AsnC ligand binding domain-containing protein [Bacteroidaceae bacterium]|nr:Lrp/AsnC ligand binding domain-containing protein [Bacteroidaceae bacterium]
MAKDEKLDALDRKILKILSKSARTPFKDVAEVCGVSRAAIHQRVQKMVDDEVILGSMFIVNPKSVGYLTCTYVGIQLEKGNMSGIVTDELYKIPEVVECHLTTGPYSMLAKVYARDNEQLLDLLHNKIAQIEGIASTETLISLDQCIMREIPVCEPISTPVKSRTRRNVPIRLDEDAE